MIQKEKWQSENVAQKPAGGGVTSLSVTLKKSFRSSESRRSHFTTAENLTISFTLAERVPYYISSLSALRY